MPRLPRRPLTLLLSAVLLGGLASCKTPEQLMIEQVESLRERGRYDAALDYLETYLGKYSDSLAGWRYRVMIRLDQERRPEAAAEYSALNAALARHEPQVLREVVLGAGGRWLVSDYSSLARCGGGALGGVSFFEDVLTPKHLGEGSMTKVAVRADEIAAVIDSLPGSLDPNQTWALISPYGKGADADLQARTVRAAGRHLEAEGFEEASVAGALDLIRGAAGSASGELREAALLAAILAPTDAALGQSVVVSSCHEKSPREGLPSPCGGWFGGNAEKVAPCGSWITANRPTFGMSVGDLSTLAPRSSA